jgi:putative transposase
MAWSTFLQADWPPLVAADVFTTEVWTARGLVTYYVAFLLDVQSRRIQMIGCTPYPNEAFVIQCLRQATAETGPLCDGRILLCDRDPKWSRGVEQWLATAGVRVVRTPPCAPNCNAYAERCVPVGERGMPEPDRPAPRAARAEGTARIRTHYNRERNHQGLANELIERPPAQ